MSQHKKILIIAPPWIGDMVMTNALLRLLKKQDPDCSIDVFAIPMLHPIIRRMPEVDNCISSPLKHGDIKLFERFNIGRSLRKNGYTHAYFIPNSLKSSLVPFFAKIPTRVGWVGERRYFLLNDIRVLDKKKLPLMVERFAALGYEKDEVLPQPLPLLLPRLQVSLKQLDSVLGRLKIPSPQKPILAICPGPEHRSAKRWPPEHFADVARAKKNEGWDVWLFGGPKEQMLAQIVQERSHNACLDLTGKTDLGEVVDLLSLAKVVVANDSGLMHVASALNKPIIAIYGPTPPELAPPLTGNKFKTLSLNLPCSPCSKTECVLKHNKCMYDLKPELVLQAITEIV